MVWLWANAEDIPIFSNFTDARMPRIDVHTPVRHQVDIAIASRVSKSFSAFWMRLPFAETPGRKQGNANSQESEPALAGPPALPEVEALLKNAGDWAGEKPSASQELTPPHGNSFWDWWGNHCATSRFALMNSQGIGKSGWLQTLVPRALTVRECKPIRRVGDGSDCACTPFPQNPPTQEVGLLRSPPC